MHLGPVPSPTVVELFGRGDPIARRLLEYLARRRGVCRETAAQVATRLGLSNRFVLAHRLVRAGLPPFSRLKDLVWLECCLMRWEHDGTSLRRQAFEVGAKPKRWYEKVKRVSGHSWSELRERGPAWIVVGVALGGGATTRTVPTSERRVANHQPR